MRYTVCQDIRYTSGFWFLRPGAPHVVSACERQPEKLAAPPIPAAKTRPTTRRGRLCACPAFPRQIDRIHGIPAPYFRVGILSPKPDRSPYGRRPRSPRSHSFQMSNIFISCSSPVRFSSFPISARVWRAPSRCGKSAMP
jgi:hypothetical protein